jgi:hypothetical protein
MGLYYPIRINEFTGIAVGIISVVVVGGLRGRGGGVWGVFGGKEAADAACALEGVGEVESPDVGFGGESGGGVVGGCGSGAFGSCRGSGDGFCGGFMDDVPSVVEIEGGFGGCGVCRRSVFYVLAFYTVMVGVVVVFNDLVVGEGDLYKAVFAIPCVGFTSAVGEGVAVVVVGGGEGGIGFCAFGGG